MASKTAKAQMPTEEFDRRFDDGEDMAVQVDWSKARHIARPDHHLDLTFPAWMFDRLESEAARIGVATDALIKIWLADRLER